MKFSLHIVFRRALVALFSIGCFVATAHAADTTPLPVVASFSILGDMVREVGGDRVSVSVLVGPDGDAHVYTPTPADARSVGSARLVFVNGLHFEGWMERLIQAAGYRGKVVVASAGVVPRKLEGGQDPHAWQSLANGRRYVENIRAALVAALPQDADVINARAAAYSAKIEALDKTVRGRFQGLPPAARRVITTHDAFGYFGAAYGVQFLAAEGVSTESEASAASVAGLIRQVRDKQVRALFLENVTDPRLIERIAAEAGGIVGGKLYSDALSPAGGPADSYLKMFAYNVDTLSAAMRRAAVSH